VYDVVWMDVAFVTGLSWEDLDRFGSEIGWWKSCDVIQCQSETGKSVVVVFIVGN